LEPSQGEEFGTYEKDGEGRATSKAGVSGIVELGDLGKRKGRALRMDANSNLIFARSVLPTLMGVHEMGGGEAWIAAGVFGLPNVNHAVGATRGWLQAWDRRPGIGPRIVDYVKV
jgi:hypothetical protein